MAFSISQRRAIPFPNAPSVPSVGFGFNLAPTISQPSSPNLTSVQSPPRQPLGPPTTSVRSQNAPSTKRRWEPDVEAELEDDNMGGRSPSPSERPRKGPPKRVRVDDHKAAGSADGKPSQEQQEADSIDTGVLLGTLSLILSVVAHIGITNVHNHSRTFFSITTTSLSIDDSIILNHPKSSNQALANTTHPSSDPRRCRVRIEHCCTQD